MWVASSEAPNELQRHRECQAYLGLEALLAGVREPPHMFPELLYHQAALRLQGVRERLCAAPLADLPSAWVPIIYTGKDSTNTCL